MRGHGRTHAHAMYMTWCEQKACTVRPCRSTRSCSPTRRRSGWRRCSSTWTATTAAWSTSCPGRAACACRTCRRRAPLPRPCGWRQQQPAGTVHCAVRPVVEQAPLHSPPASIGWCARRNRAVLFVGLGAASAAGTVQCCMQPMHVLHPMAAASPGRACPCQQLQQARWWLAVGPVLQAGLARLPCRAQVQAAGGRTVLSGRG